MNIIGWNINDEDARKGMLSSILLHLILLLICLMPFVFTTTKNQETQQIIVTFSDLNDDTPTASAAASSAVSEDVPEETNEEPKEPGSKTTTTTDQAAQEKAEKTPIKQETKPKEVINDPIPEQETSPVKVEDVSANEREEALKKAKAEEAMLREEERRAEAEKKRKAEELAKKKSSFGSLFNNTASENTNEETDGKGEDISAYIQPTHTIGGGLGNRNVLFEPTVTDSSRKVGRVVISICVDRAGQVSSANFTQKGSTTSDARLIKLATQAALKYRFNTSELAEQCGSVTFEFTLK